MADAPIWGIHAGKTGDADKLFFSENVIAIGWEEFGDLGTCTTRENYRARYAQVYPTTSPMGIANSAGQLFRFVHEVKPGHLGVSYPSKVTRNVHVGEVVDPYRYRPDVSAGYPNQRPVRWMGEIPRTSLSSALLMELGTAMSLFSVKPHAAELRAALAGKAAPVGVVVTDSDTGGGIDADEAEQLTRDFILKRIAQKLKGLAMEDLVKHLLELLGYRVRKTPVNEPSVDLIAHKDVLGLGPPIIKAQVKSGDGAVSDRDVSALVGKLGPAEYGLIVTISSYSPPAQAYATGKQNLRLIDGNQLVDMILDLYEGFDPSFKAVLPLRRVYIPQLTTDG